MNERVGRNDPCPCGSGRKYKHCHAEKQSLGERNVAGIRLWVIAAIGAAAIAVIVLVSMANRGAFRQPASATPYATQTPEPAGAPWQYDSLTNRYFDPGHGHWHDGPPPPPEQRNAGASGVAPIAPGAPTLPGQPAAGATPAPYTYDAAGNRHWDPAHQHWHTGPPPSGAPAPGGTP